MVGWVAFCLGLVILALSVIVQRLANEVYGLQARVRALEEKR